MISSREVQKSEADKNRNGCARADYVPGGRYQAGARIRKITGQKKE
jgi:hypothetical protein